ncbi:MAG: hypothetical protein ACT4P4_00565 [Betaproteobacteria bacterium]
MNEVPHEVSEAEVKALQREVETLRNRVAELEGQIQFLQTHEFLTQGIRGETLVCELTRGTASALGTGYDALVGRTLKLEVKYSRLRTPVQGAVTRRWQWSRPLGWNNYGKDFDLLLLVGEKDRRYPKQYLDDSAYVYFLVPKARVEELMTVDRHMNAGHITVSTNLANTQSSRSSFLRTFMVPFQHVERLNPIVAKSI